MNREKQFNDFTGFNFSELEKIKYKPGCQPRNATDYYYHLKSKMIYYYYFGDNGRWQSNDNIDLNDIKSPSILLQHQKVSINNTNSRKLKKLHKKDDDELKIISWRT